MPLGPDTLFGRASYVIRRREEGFRVSYSSLKGCKSLLV